MNPQRTASQPPRNWASIPDYCGRRYAAERAKRLRADGNSQYQEITGQFDHFNEDPYVEPGFTRPALHEELDVVIVGGGFGGLLAAARLQKVGITNIRIVEKAGDFGGTWYWNRYPGAQCDIESYLYLPLLEETGYIPKERYSFAPEILAHAQRIGKHFHLYEKACFQTQDQRGTLGRERHRAGRLPPIAAMCSRRASSMMSSGPLNRPKFPAIPGIEKFKGHTFHTSRWDYDYTGGDTTGGLHKLQRQTGGDHRDRSDRDSVHTASGPTREAALRLPAHAIFSGRAQQHADRSRMGEEAQAGLAGVSQPQLHRPSRRSRSVEEDQVRDKWTSPFKKLGRADSKARTTRSLSADDRAALAEIADFQKMNEIRDRVTNDR